MQWTIPGTTLQMNPGETDRAEELFRAMFMAGGMVLGQVAQITGLEPYTVQNWVKRGFLPPPVNRRYSLSQLCRVIQINMLKNALSLEAVCELLSFINGKLDEAADDIIDDATLYFLFVRLAARAKELDSPQARNAALEDALSGYREPVPGAKERVRQALRIMLTAWIAGRLRQEAEQMLRSTINSCEAAEKGV